MSASGQCLNRDQCSFWHEISVQSYYTAYSFSRTNDANTRWEELARSKSPRRESPSGRKSRQPCKDHLTGTCTNPSCERWHSQECVFYKTDLGCKFGDKCAFVHRRVEEQPSKRSKKNGDKSAVAALKETNNLGCVFQDVEPPKSSSILRKSSTMRKPIRVVRCTGATLRDARVPDQNPSLNKICPGEPHQRNPNAPKFEDRTQEETEWQEHWAREAAWRLAKKNRKIKGEKENYILLATGKVVSPFTILN